VHCEKLGKCDAQPVALEPGLSSPGLNTVAIAAIITSAALATVLVLLCGLLAYIKKLKERRQRSAESSKELELTEPKKSVSGQTFTSTGVFGSLTNSPMLRMSPNIYMRNIKVERCLGSGRFGEVYLGVLNGTSLVALKRLKKGTSREFENELKLLMKLNHPNIVRFLGIYRESHDVYLVMEYLAKGALSDFLSQERMENKLTTVDLLCMVSDLAAALMHLELKNIIHRDLGARNLLVSEADGRYIIKLADLGLSREVKDDLYEATDNTFPVKWSPPEVITRRQYTSKSDVWSFGVCVWEIFEFGKIPFGTMSNQEALEYILQGYRLSKPARCPDSVFEIMQLCWRENPIERPNFTWIYMKISTILEEYNRRTVEDEVKAQQDTLRQSTEQIIYNN